MRMRRMPPTPMSCPVPISPGEELSVRVLPRQADEFTWASCFLVTHRSQIDHVEGTLIICKECAAA